MTKSTVLYDTPGPRANLRYRTIGFLSLIALIGLVFVIIRRLYDQGQLEYELWEPFVTPAYMELLWQGLIDTVQAAVFAIIGAVIFGLVFGVGKMSIHWYFRWPSWLIVEFFRAVPLLLLIVFVWSLYDLQLDRSFRSLVIALILYNGAVLAEVFRAGVNAIPKGQSEAAYALGMRKSQVMSLVLLPQAIKIMLPSIISQCVVALKDTSLGYVILAPGLTTVGREIWREFNNRLATALVLLVLYLILNLLLDWIGHWVAKRYAGGRKLDVGAVGALGELEQEAEAERIKAKYTDKGSGYSGGF